MGFKYQLITANFPQAVYQVTMNHLDGIAKIIREGPAIKLIENVKKTMMTKFSKFTNNDFMVMRKELLRYLQDKVIRVSVFLQDEIQTAEGRIIVENKGYGGVGISRPGTISYYNQDGKVISTANFQVDGSPQFIENKNQTFLEAVPTELGHNIYEKERKKKIDTTALKKTETKAEFTKLDQTSQKKELNSQQAKKELNLLATLLGTEAVDKKESLAFNLFPELNKSTSIGSSESDYADIIVIDTVSSPSSQIQSVIKSLEDPKAKNQEQAEEEVDDLLALMDQAN